MTLWINELSFSNAKIVGSNDNISVVATAVHNSNYPDFQKVGVSDTHFEVTLTINTEDVNRTLAQLRGSLRNKEFAIFRSDTQHLRDDKKIVFAKVTSIIPTRKTGTQYFTEIKLSCKYVGTQASHQPTFFVNSVQIPNDWGKAGTTMIALPVGAYSPTETVSTGQIANHPIVVTPTWASGIDSNNSGYTVDSVARGTIGFNVDFTTIFNNSVRCYDGSGTSGSHITDTDYEVQWSGGIFTIRQDGWMEIQFNKTAKTISFRKPSGATFVEFFKVFPNDGFGFNDVYILAMNDHYIRVGLDSEDEFEMFSCKLPSLFPGSRNPYYTGTTLFTGSVVGGADSFNFVQAQSGAFLGANRYFTVETTSAKHYFKPATNAGNSGSDIQYWFSYDTTNAAADKNFKYMLRRLE